MIADELVNIVYEDVVKNGQKYCFILGAGASLTSNIKSGNELAKEWFEEWESRQPLEASNFREDNYLNDNYGNFYSQIFENNFKNADVKAKKTLHHEIIKGIPSSGYYYLSKILSQIGNLVITTNFDYLVEDSLYTFERQKAFSVSDLNHAVHIEQFTSIPVIAKIHGDTFLKPLNTSKELEELKDEWDKKLKELLFIYTPIVIGHSGNDPDLMALLKNSGAEKIYWCLYHKEKPSKKVNELVNALNGSLIPILGFDEVVFLLGEKFNFASPNNDIERFNSETKNKFDETYENALKNVKKELNDISEAEIILSNDLLTITEKLSAMFDTFKEQITYEHADLGKEYVFKQEHSKAKEELLLALKHNPENIEALFWAMSNYNILGDYNSGIACCSQIIQKIPYFYPIYLFRGVMYLSKYESKEKKDKVDIRDLRCAIFDFIETQKLESQLTVAYMLTALCYAN
ncbi:MAG: SIR2 family protein [Oscillospiraceae bacterium]|nr:SIR2 family protein [Oscillospiraceae bacterium]